MTTTQCKYKDLTVLFRSSTIPTSKGTIKFKVAIQDEALKIDKLGWAKETLDWLVSHRLTYAYDLLLMEPDHQAKRQKYLQDKHNFLV